MDTPSSDPVLVLVGHGSATDPAAAAGTVAAAAWIARRRRVSVVAATVKGEPSLGGVLRSLAPEKRVVVLPHFAGDGVFARRFIPDIVRTHGAHLHDVRVTPALGGAQAVVRHVETLLGHVADTLADVPDLLVVAHGSTASAAGDRAAEDLALALGGGPACGAAHTVFLEHEPALTHWRRLPLGRDVLVCVMLAARGRHARMDVPAAFNLPLDAPLVGTHGEAVGPLVIDGRRLWLHAPLADPRLMADAAEALAAEALRTPEPHLLSRALDHSQGPLAATA